MTEMFKDAELSECGTYRWTLTRKWSDETPTMVFIMLNPSTADASVDDPTIRRCMSFAMSHDCGGMKVVNLFPFRAADPKDLAVWWGTKDRDALAKVMADNEDRIRSFLQAASTVVVAAWGAHKIAREPGARVVQLSRSLNVPLHALGINRDESPKHPLYVRGDARFVPWPAPTDVEFQAGLAHCLPHIPVTAFLGVAVVDAELTPQQIAHVQHAFPGVVISNERHRDQQQTRIALPTAKW